jgi:hypothetical protein
MTRGTTLVAVKLPLGLLTDIHPSSVCTEEAPVCTWQNNCMLTRTGRQLSATGNCSATITFNAIFYNDCSYIITIYTYKIQAFFSRYNNLQISTRKMDSQRKLTIMV